MMRIDEAKTPHARDDEVGATAKRSNNELADQD